MKQVARLMIFGLLLACLYGCYAPPAVVLVVEVSPDSGRPPFEVTVTVTDMGEGTYTYEISGQEAVESTEAVFTTLVDRYPWKVRVTWTDGAGGFSEATATVGLENEIPVAHGLWTVPNNYSDRGLILIDLRYLEHGCRNGTALSYTGFEDPDYTAGGYSMENDAFTYHVEVEDVATGQRESIFYGPDRTLMRDEYVSGSIFYWFVNWSVVWDRDPPYPYPVWSPMVCPCPTPDPEPGAAATIEKRIYVSVREFGATRRWVYTVFAAAPGCSN